MGGLNSKKRNAIISILDNYSFSKADVVSQLQFTTSIFNQLDYSADHTEFGPIFVNQTHVLKAFYDYLAMDNRGVLTKAKLKKVIEKIYDEPEKSIEYSYRIIAGDRDRIMKTEFTNFISTCLEKGIESINKLNRLDGVFQKSLREWVAANKPKLILELRKAFHDNANSDKESWTLGDFKRWILSKDHWMMYVQIKEVAYKIPLNIPCLFGIRIDKEE